MTALTEADVERVALDWLTGLGWSVAYGPDISPDGSRPERTDYGAVVLEARCGTLSTGSTPVPRPRRWRTRSEG